MQLYVDRLLLDPYRFDHGPVCTLIPVNGTDGRTGQAYEYVAFIPHRLGDEPPLTNSAWHAVTAANRALGALDQAGEQVTESWILRLPTLRREAQSASALEGTFAPLAEVLGADEKDVHGAELTEVLNYVSAAELGYNALADGHRISLPLLTELHAHLVRGTQADTRYAGRVRSIQVAIGGPGSKIRDARFVPSPPAIQLEAAGIAFASPGRRRGAGCRSTPPQPDQQQAVAVGVSSALAESSVPQQAAPAADSAEKVALSASTV